MSSLDHSAFLYDSDAEYLAVLLPFLRDGLAREYGLAVATSPARITLLRDALGTDARTVVFLPDEEWHVRPARTIGAWARLLSLATKRGRPRTRLVGQVPFGAAPQSWIRFESVLNAALADATADLLCPYDRREVTAEVADSAGRTHPRLHGEPTDAYLKPEVLLDQVPEPSIAAPGPPLVRLPIGDTVAGLRETVRSWAAGHLPADRLDDLLLAVNEVATNGVRHGGPERSLAVWATPEAVICEVADNGVLGPSPLAGYLPPVRGVPGGMGLWLVRQVCDAVHIAVSGGGTRVRFAVAR
jgi:anti-sigma regulatory factor (Ser/Thr protein kinase)